MADYSVNGNLTLKTKLDIIGISGNLLGGSLGGLRGAANSSVQIKNMTANMVTGFNSFMLLTERLSSSIRKAIEPMDNMVSIVNRTKQAYHNMYTDLTSNRITNLIKNRSNASYTDLSTFGNVLARLSFVKPELGIHNISDITSTIMKAGYLGGSQPQELRSTVLQLMQGIGSNQLGGDELRSIRENAPGIVKYLSQGLRMLAAEDPTKYGVFANAAPGNIKQLGEEKLLTSDVVTRALLKIGDIVNEDFKYLTPTLQMSSNVIGNELLSKVFNSGMPKFLEPIKEVVGDISKIITEDNNGILSTVDNISQIVQTTLNSAKPIFTALSGLIGIASKFFNTTLGQGIINFNIYRSILSPIMSSFGKAFSGIAKNDYLNSVFGFNRSVEDSVIPKKYNRVRHNILEGSIYNNAIFNNAQFIGGNYGGFGGISSGPSRPRGGGPFVSPVEPIYSNYNDTSYRYWFDLSHRIGRSSYPMLGAHIDPNYFNGAPQLGAFPDDSYFNSSRIYEHFNDYKWSYFAKAAGYYNAANFAKNGIGRTPLLTGSIGQTTYTDEAGNTFTADVVDGIDETSVSVDQIANISRNNFGILSGIGSVLSNPMTTFGISAIISTVTAIGGKIASNIQNLKNWGASGSGTMDAIAATQGFLGSGFGYYQDNNDVLFMRKNAAKSIQDIIHNNPEAVRQYLQDYVTDDDERNRMARFLFGGHFTYTGEGQNLKLVDDEGVTSGLSDFLRAGKDIGVFGDWTEEGKAIKFLYTNMFSRNNSTTDFAKSLDLDLQSRLFPQVEDIDSNIGDISKTIKTNYNKQKIDYMTNVAGWYADKRAVGQKSINVNGVSVTINTTSGDINTLTADALVDGLKAAFGNSPFLP